MMREWQTQTTLLPHQVPAVEKLRPSRVGGLFMDMGTGKTRTAIELAHLRQARCQHVVWFCPVNLKPTIAYEWRKHATLPDAEVYEFDDTTTERTVPDRALYIVGLESLGSSNRVTLAVNALITAQSFVVVDESSYIKGPYSRRTERLTLLCERAKYRLILTGTPVTQGVQDLFAQMRFLSPKILGYRSFYSFAANHLEYSTKYPEMVVRAHNTGLLASKIAPYVYQVTKNECLDLPPKLYDQRYVRLTAEQSAAYQEAKHELLFRLEDEAISVYDIFRLYTALQQIVCGFWHHRDGLRTYPHMRLSVLADALRDIDAGEPVIVWTKYRHCVHEIVQSFGSDAVAYDGEGTPAARERALAHWRAHGRLLVATPNTGSHGLTLNEAAYHLFYTNSFKYTDRIQAEDRSHRLGQHRPVTYVDIVAEGTIDMRIQASLARKEGLATEFRRLVAQCKDMTKKELRQAMKTLIEAL